MKTSTDLRVSARWIQNPFFDFTFILPGFWLAILLFVFQYFNLLISASLWFFLLVSCGHIVAPLWTVARNSEVRGLLLAKEKFFKFWCILVFVTPAILMAISAGIYSQSGQKEIAYLPVFAVFLAYFIFNSWHFGMQNFGVIRSYKKVNAAKDSHKFDFILCIFIQMVILTAIWFDFGIRNDFLSQVGFFTKNSLSPQFIYFLYGLLLILFLMSIWRWAYNKVIALSYVHYFLVQFLVMLNPLFFTLTLYSGTHHLQEFGLNSILNKKAKSTFRIFPYIVALVAVSLVIGFIHIQFPKYFPNITLFGAVKYDQVLSSMDYTISCLFFGLWMGVNFLHFYVSRIIYRTQIFSPLEQREDVV